MFWLIIQGGQKLARRSAILFKSRQSGIEVRLAFCLGQNYYRNDVSNIANLLKNLANPTFFISLPFSDVVSEEQEQIVLQTPINKMSELRMFYTKKKLHT